MEYREKVQLIEEAVTQIKTGSTMDEVKNALTAKGYSTEDLFVLTNGINREIDFQYQGDILDMIQGGKERDIAEKFSFLAPEKIKELTLKAKQKYHKQILLQLKKQVSAGGNKEQLVMELQRHSISEEEKFQILQKLANDQAENPGRASGGGGNTAVGAGTALLGMVMIIAGVVISANTNRIMYGLVLVGAGFVIKGIVSMAT